MNLENWLNENFDAVAKHPAGTLIARDGDYVFTIIPEGKNTWTLRHFDRKNNTLSRMEGLDVKLVQTRIKEWIGEK